jgi:hypothetical protein
MVGYNLEGGQGLPRTLNLLCSRKAKITARGSVPVDVSYAAGHFGRARGVHAAFDDRACPSSMVRSPSAMFQAIQTSGTNYCETPEAMAEAIITEWIDQGRPTLHCKA